MGLLARAIAKARGEDADAMPRGATPASPEELLLASGLPVEDQRAAWLAASWLLTYPDAEALAHGEQIRELVAALPGRTGEALRTCLDAIGRIDPLELQELYVDTFDTRRRGCLYLTYFSQGDTRRRGMALVRIKQDYRAAGLEMDDSELPDHLAVVLEFAAAHDPMRGAKILRANRAGIEMLRLHLEEIASPWHGALVAICSTLPPMDADDREAVARLAAEGPAEETVGLDGYGVDTDSISHDALIMHDQTMSGAGCGDQAASPGPVPLDLMRGRPS